MISNGTPGWEDQSRAANKGDASNDRNEAGIELRRQALLAEEQADEDRVQALLLQELGAVEIASYENKPEYVLIAAVREDPHAFNGMWYPTALSEDGLTVLAQNQPDGFEENNLFFIRVTTDVEGLV